MTVAAAPPVTPMRRVAGACLVGSAIEFYDFLIYGTAAALVFPTVFFPHLSPAMGTIASMGTFASAFVSRPIGGAAFGYFGDRLGRKRTLIATLVLMAVATVSVGLVPRTESIGIAAPLILVALRLVQGFAAGGEWAGSVLLSAEYAPADKRGRYGMFTLLGGGVAAVLSCSTFLVVSVTIGEDSPAFLEWGWRIPFLISAVLIGIALYVRLRIDETPVFVAEKVRDACPEGPDRGVATPAAARDPSGGRQHPGRHGLRLHGEHLPDQIRARRTGLQPQFHLGSGCVGRAGERHVRRALGHAVRSSRAAPDDVAGLGGMCAVGGGGDAADRHRQTGALRTGDRRHVRSGWDRFRADGAFIPELFATRYRYSGSAFAINFAGVFGGALPPLVAGTVQATYGGWAIGPMLAVLAAASFVCTYLLPETKGTTLHSGD